MYTILVGGPGTKKNTAINIAKKLIRLGGYSTFAPAKTTKEKLYIDMAAQSKGEAGLDDFLDTQLFGSIDTSNEVHTLFIASGEFETFFGNNILDFVKDLGELWDYEGPFESKVKTGESVTVHNPTISILGGITPSQLSTTFPPQMIGQGFFSRCLFIYGEKTRPKITFQEDVDEEVTDSLVRRLTAMLPTVPMRVFYTDGAKALIDKIYKSDEIIADIRFESYYNRRLAQLFKLCIICMVCTYKKIIDEEVVVYANTMLCHAESLMPKALGEFGKARNSDVSHKIISFVEAQHGIVTFKDIWKLVSADLEKITDLGTMLQNLVTAEKLQQVKGGSGYLPNRRVIKYDDSSTFNFELLTEEERKLVI